MRRAGLSALGQKCLDILIIAVTQSFMEWPKRYSYDCDGTIFYRVTQKIYISHRYTYYCDDTIFYRVTQKISLFGAKTCRSCFRISISSPALPQYPGFATKKYFMFFHQGINCPCWFVLSIYWWSFSHMVEQLRAILGRPCHMFPGLPVWYSTESNRNSGVKIRTRGNINPQCLPALCNEAPIL